MQTLIDREELGTLVWDDEAPPTSRHKTLSSLWLAREAWFVDTAAYDVGQSPMTVYESHLDDLAQRLTLGDRYAAAQWAAERPRTDNLALFFAGESRWSPTAADAAVPIVELRKSAPVTSAKLEWDSFFEHREAATGAWLRDEPHIRLVEVTPAQDEQLRAEFDRLAEEWEDATWMYSFVERKIIHRAYQRIIGMGSPSVALILDRLKTHGPDHWFWALEMITGASPAAHAQTMEEAMAAWLAWGRERGLA
jgi:hypothetical protein